MDKRSNRATVSMNYYIYYRVIADDAETELLIRSMQSRLGCSSRVSGYLLKRSDDPLTWMEVYENVGDATSFERQMSRLLAATDIEMFIDGNRIVERFLRQ